MAVALGVLAAAAALLAPRLEGHEPVPVQPSSCAPDVLADAQTPHAVCGTVHGGAGAPPGSLAVACMGEHPKNGMEVDAQGRFQGWVPSGACELTAFRTEGGLSDPGTGAWIDPNPGDVVEVDLWVPDHPPAGMGIELGEDGRGLYASRIHPGTPAERAGIRQGDRILDIDGAPTSEMTMWEFIERGVDRPGSIVTARVGTFDDNHVVSMRREEFAATW